MTDTVRERCCKGLLARLAVAAAAVGDGCVVQRNGAFAVDHYPTLMLVDRGEGFVTKVVGEQSGCIEYQAEVLVELHAAAADSGALTALLDVMYLETLRALAADRTLGGVARDAVEVELAGSVPPESDSEREIAVNALTLRIDFSTTSDPTVVGPL